MKDIMIDLETMGKGATAAIVAIGACYFDPQTGNIGEKFYANVDLQSALDVGLTVDGSTVMWWLEQSSEARASLAVPDALPIGAALSEFSAWVRAAHDFRLDDDDDDAPLYNAQLLRAAVDPDDVCVWGNGAAFDNAKLSHAYTACHLEQPWKHWGDRCYRTVKASHPDIAVERIGTHHNALDDAITQALHMSEIYRRGRGWHTHS